MEAVSFGKEKPAVQGSTEEAMARTAALRSFTAKPGPSHGTHDAGAQMVLALLAATSMGSACAGLFDDDEAQAILDLRQKVRVWKRVWPMMRAVRKRTRRSCVAASSNCRASSTPADLNLRNCKASKSRWRVIFPRGAAPAKDTTQSVDERLRRFEPSKVSVDGREFMADPTERRDFENGHGHFSPWRILAASCFGRFSEPVSQTGYRPSALFWLAMPSTPRGTTRTRWPAFAH